MRYPKFRYVAPIKRFHPRARGHAKAAQRLDDTNAMFPINDGANADNRDKQANRVVANNYAYFFASVCRLSRFPPNAKK